MALLVEDCPRCGAQKTTFDIGANVTIGQDFGWAKVDELFCICRHCARSTIFVTVQRDINNPDFLKTVNAINRYVDVKRYISVRDINTTKPPEYVPSVILEAFREATTCLAVECFAASVVMSRKCVDLAIKQLIPDEASGGPKNADKKPLGPRLDWLFEQKILPGELKVLADSVKEDGNDGAHSDLTMTRGDADDAIDFVISLLERLYTEPGRIAAADERRRKRREKPSVAG